MSAVKRMKELLKRPPWVIAKDLADHIPGRPVQIQRLLVLVLPDVSAVATQSSGRVREGIPNDVPGMSLLEDKDPGFLFQRFEGGMSCAVAVSENGKIVGYAWYSSKPFHFEEITGYRVEIPWDSIYAYDAFVVPEYRRRGIFLEIKAYLRDRARVLGRKSIVVLVDPTNHASLKANFRCGYHIARDVLCFRVFSRWFHCERDASALLSR